jgi:hypothetical protein
LQLSAAPSVAGWRSRLEPQPPIAGRGSSPSAPHPTTREASVRHACFLLLLSASSAGEEVSNPRWRCWGCSSIESQHERQHAMSPNAVLEQPRWPWAFGETERPFTAASSLAAAARVEAVLRSSRSRRAVAPAAVERMIGDMQTVIRRWQHRLLSWAAAKLLWRRWSPSCMPAGGSSPGRQPAVRLFLCKTGRLALSALFPDGGGVIAAWCCSRGRPEWRESIYAPHASPNAHGCAEGASLPYRYHHQTHPPPTSISLAARNIRLGSGASWASPQPHFFAPSRYPFKM